MVSLVTVNTTAGGRIDSLPVGISCNPTCSSYFPKSTPISLMAIPDTDYNFTNWSGACTGSGACSFTPSTPTTVNATFTAIPQDTTPPNVSIISPTNNSTVNTSSITVTGTASDPSGVSSVTVNGVNAQTTNSYSNWTANVTLTEGANTLNSRAVDSRNNIANSSITVTYTVPVGGSLLWVNTIGNTGTDIGYAVAVDKKANCDSQGGTNCVVIVGTGVVYSSHPFVAKYTSNGQLLWQSSPPGPGYGNARAISIDNQGNILVTGNFYGTQNFGGVSLTSSGGYDIFLAKYSPAGSIMWAKRYGTSYPDNIP